jgi:hypothetical protein
MPFRKADNTRVDGKRGPISGWDAVRSRIIGLLDDKGEPRGVPMLYCFDTCRVLIRTIPTLQHDPARPEDVLKGPTDDACDEVRYACLSRPWVRTIKAPEPEGEAPAILEGFRGTVGPLADWRSSDIRH